MIENIDVESGTTCKTIGIILLSFMLPLIVFHLNFTQNYFKTDFSQIKFLSINPSSNAPLTPNPLSHFPILFSNHHVTQPIAIGSDNLRGALVTYFSKSLVKIFNKSIAAAKRQDPTMHREICSK